LAGRQATAHTAAAQRPFGPAAPRPVFAITTDGFPARLGLPAHPDSSANRRADIFLARGFFNQVGIRGSRFRKLLSVSREPERCR